MIKLFLLRCKLTSFSVFRNKVRLLLTICGISLGLFFFIFGNAAIDAYLQSMYDDADAFDETGYIIAGSEDDAAWFEGRIRNGVEGKSISYSFSSTYRANSKVIYRNVTIDHFALLIGCPANFTHYPIFSNGESSYFLGKSKVLYGRDLSDEDSNTNALVCVLEKSTSLILFQKENSIGETLHVMKTDGYYDFEVVGIIEDLHPKKQENFALNKRIAKGESEIQYNFNAYIPETSYRMVNEKEGYISNHVFVIDKNDREKMEQIMASLTEEAVKQHRDVSVISQSVLRAEVKETEANIRGVLFFLMLFVFLFSSFVILTIILFSVKERVYEIGVRRALGASRTDILIQFVSEGLIYSLMSATLAVVCSIFIGNYVTYFLKNVFFINIALRISPQLIFATFGISMIQGVLFSFFPAVVASRVRPTEAIRWD